MLELIEENNDYFDEIMDGGKKVFKFILQGDLLNNDVRIKFTPIKGNPKIFINPESLPVGGEENSVWKSTTSQEIGSVRNVIITKEERNNSETKMTAGYIIVTATEPSSFYVKFGQKE